MAEKPIECLQVFQHRGGLKRTLKALQEGKLTIGFIGGSITETKVWHNWPEYVIAWFAEKFPHVRLYVENIALGGTGSGVGVFNADKYLIERDCDLVFIEYAVNDFGVPVEKTNRTREGLIRKLLGHGSRDIVLVHTFCHEMYENMLAGKIPSSIREFETLADHYSIGSVWAGLWTLNEVLRGRLRWETWLPVDGIHPFDMGSLSYARSVIAFMEKELCANPSKKLIPSDAARPAPLYPGNWEFAGQLPFSKVKTRGPWAVQRWYLFGIDQVLATSAPGAALSFEFTGRTLVLAFDFGKTSSEFRYRIDGHDRITTERGRYDWMGFEGGCLRLTELADNLKVKKHTVEIEVIHGGKDCRGTNFRLAFVGVVP